MPKPLTMRTQGMRVTCRGKEGRIEGPFGKSGKFKVYFKDGGIEREACGVILETAECMEMNIYV